MTPDRPATVPQHVRALIDFEMPPENDPDSLMGRDRYICRGDACLIVSSSGTGKSVMNYQWAMLAALGRPFLGIVAAYTTCVYHSLAWILAKIRENLRKLDL